jgi:hypothetical protein
LLNGEIFYTLQEAQIVIEAWRRHFNAVGPHWSLKGRPPAPESITVLAAHGIRPWLAWKKEQSEEGLAGNRPAHEHWRWTSHWGWVSRRSAIRNGGGGAHALRIGIAERQRRLHPAQAFFSAISLDHACTAA